MSIVTADDRNRIRSRIHTANVEHRDALQLVTILQEAFLANPHSRAIMEALQRAETDEMDAATELDDATLEAHNHGIDI